MSLAGRIDKTAPSRGAAVLRALVANLTEWLGALLSTRRVRAARRPRWAHWGRLLVGATLSVAAVAAAMVFLDAWAITHQRTLPQWIVTGFGWVTGFGRSGWVLVPVGGAIIVLAGLSSPRLRRLDRLVLAALAARLGYVFVAVGLPGLIVTIVKRLIGRARPYLFEAGSPFDYAPFKWDGAFASLPSGHGTTAFAAAFAIGALCPRLRVPLWIFAAVIAVSRVAISAHYPSDVVAGAIVGVFGAVVVRDWFASRRLAFVIVQDDGVRALPLPPRRRLLRALRRMVAR